MGSSNNASIVPSTVVITGSIISSTTQSPMSSMVSPIHLIGFLIISFMGSSIGAIKISHLKDRRQVLCKQCVRLRLQAAQKINQYLHSLDVFALFS